MKKFPAKPRTACLCFGSYALFFFLFASIPVSGQVPQGFNHLPARLKSIPETIQLLDSMVVERYNESTGQWAIRWKEEFIYSSEGRLVQMIYGSWVKAEGDRNKFKENYNYDTAGNLTLAFCWRWDTLTGKWVNDHKYESTFDASGNLIKKTSYFWHGDDSLWADDYIYEYTYDANGYQIQEIYMYWENGNNKWLKYSRFDYTNDEDGNCTQFIRYKWNSDVNQWMVSYKYEYAFNNNGNEIQLMVSAWDTDLSQWLTAAKHDYSWDANGNNIQDLGYDWDTITGQWINREKYDYSYDVNGNVILYMLYHWNTDSNDWSYFDRGFNYYSSLNITEISDEEATEIIVWPNPAGDFIVFELQDFSVTAVVELFDIQGRKVISQRLNANNRIPLSHLKSGIYLYRIHSSNGLFSGKVVIGR